MEEAKARFEEGVHAPRYHIPPWLGGSASAATPKIFAAFVAANRAIEAVTKGRKNTAQGYAFRGIDDVYNVVHSALADAGIFTVPVTLERRTSSAGKTSKGSEQILTELKMEFWCFADDGSAVIIGPLWGEGIDSSDKGTNKCMSFAQKYALIQTFTIPTDDVSEGDRETPERGAPQHVSRHKANEPAPQEAGPPLGEEIAKKVYEWFAAVGVQRATIDAKLGVKVAEGTSAHFQTLKRWQEEITKDRKRVAALFGGQSAAGSNNGAKEQGDRPAHPGG